MSQLPSDHEDHPATISRNARIGLALFAVYFAMFAAFLLVNVFSPATMTKTEVPITPDRLISLGGPNLAVVLGIGLIFAAIALSLVYMRMTRKPGA